MATTAAQVKELRQTTGVAMMECKKALDENNGDIEKAIIWLRERGLSRAAKKSGRTAADGMVAIAVSSDNKSAAMIELNCETDFAAKNEDFRTFANAVVSIALENKITDLEALTKASMGSDSVEYALTQLISKVGENMSVRRVQFIDAGEGFVTSYSHMGGKIGTLVCFSGQADDANVQVANDVAMHTAAASPRYFDRSTVNPKELEQEQELARKKLAESGKPAEIIEKIMVGQINKFYKDVCLVDQAFVKEPKTSVSQYVQSSGKSLNLVGYSRFQLGEGIEVKTENFADEVAAQLKK